MTKKVNKSAKKTPIPKDAPSLDNFFAKPVTPKVVSEPVSKMPSQTEEEPKKSGKVNNSPEKGGKKSQSKSDKKSHGEEGKTNQSEAAAIQDIENALDGLDKTVTPSKMSGRSTPISKFSIPIDKKHLAGSDEEEELPKRSARKKRVGKFVREVNSDSEGANSPAEKDKKDSDCDFTAPEDRHSSTKKHSKLKTKVSPASKPMFKTTKRSKGKHAPSSSGAGQSNAEMVSSTDKEGKADYQLDQDEHEEYDPDAELEIEGDLDDLDPDALDQDFEAIGSKKKVRAKHGVKAEDQPESDEVLDETVFIDNLPKEETAIRVMLKDVNKNIRILEKNFFEEEDSEEEERFINKLKDLTLTKEEHNRNLETMKKKSHLTQFFSIPLSMNVMDLLKEESLSRMVEAQKAHGGRMFDVITCDPPWQLSSANPTRGVAIAYSTLTDQQILQIPFDRLQTDGYLFIWVINNKYRFALQMLDHFGYTLVDEITWVKQTVNGKIAKGHGFYLQHAKETCLIGAKGDITKRGVFNIKTDVIFSQRRGQSQKPEEIYDIAEALIPNGHYLEIFGRRNNLHNGWVTIGNEL